MESQNKSVIASWVVPGVILIIAVAIMVINFTTKSSSDATEAVSRNLIKSTQVYGENFIHELELLNKVAGPVRAIAEREGKWDDKFEKDMAEILASCTDAYKVVFCDGSGQGVDGQREEIDIGGEEYFQKVKQSDSTSYIYADVNDPDESEVKKSIVVVERVAGEGNKGYLLLYYPMDKFKSLMSKSDFDSNSFLTVVDSEGNILGSAGAVNSKLLRDGNILDAVRPDNAEAARTIKNRLDNGSRGTTPVTVQGESVMLSYVPLGENRWEMILGVSQTYVDKQVSLQWENTKDMLSYLVIAVVVFICLVVVINIVSKIRNNEKKKELEDKADTDLLTGLTNKLATERKIKEYMTKHPESQSMLFVLDVDNFKKINDTMGHAFGDEVLRSLGQQIGAIFRASDIIGRIGGDEFMIFLKGVSDKEAVRKEAKKVEHFFKNFQAGEYVKYAATASIGVAIFPQEGNDFETLYKAADQGLYKAKKRGKNQLAFYRDEWGLAEGETAEPEEDETTEQS
ncbi:MAG: sensor domain-containing diguanylate cyclase [Lachnospiraceae bacterium]|nr:sensor domain-containing diguanylate cyclase [Lachnospiraceae bacterium]